MLETDFVAKVNPIERQFAIKTVLIGPRQDSIRTASVATDRVRAESISSFGPSDQMGESFC